MKRYAIFGYYGQQNAGDEAILAAFINGIKASSANCFISVYTDTPQETSSTHKITAHPPVNLSLKGFIIGILGRRRLVYLKSAINFLRTDVVIIGGGSLFFDSRETNRWLLGYLSLIKTAKRLQKKIGLIGISVGPLHHQQSKRLINEAFSNADVISVRDQLSKDLLIDCGLPPETIQVIPDLVFTLPSASDSLIDEVLRKENFCIDGKKKIAIAPCCYNTNFTGWRAQYAAFCEAIASKYGADLWVIPMQRNGVFDDLTAFDPVIESLSVEARKKIFTLKGLYPADVIQGIIGKADFVLAERLHGSIMALNTRTPFMGISYMQKVSGVLRLANLESHIISMESFLSGDFLPKVEHKISETLSHQQHVADRDLIERSARKNFDLIMSL